MKVDVLVAEIGSTTTSVSAFCLQEPPRFLGQGTFPSPDFHAEGKRDGPSPDVTVSLNGALRGLAKALGTENLSWTTMMAASSAAGGLSMTVHGLVYDMTVRAAKEAALNAGGVVRMVTAGIMTPRDLDELRKVRPKLILLAGGVDYGEKDTALENASLIAGLDLGVPVLYAGNIAARDQVKEILLPRGIDLRFADNVYPSVDQLVIEPARKVIHDIFEDHIVLAPGMDRIRSMVTGPIMPTPGAVMAACKMLHPVLGDLCAVDVGGATTDVHSVCEGSPEIQAILESPEPFAKRTVEGDLGVYVNAHNVYRLVEDRAVRDLGFDPVPLLETPQPVPIDPEAERFVGYLAKIACEVAFSRHVGRLRHLYGPGGRLTRAVGKDLSSVKVILGTGGPLTRLPGGKEALAGLCRRSVGKELYPEAARCAVDSDYIMAACGVLGREYPEEAAAILMNSFGLSERELL